MLGFGILRREKDRTPWKIHVFYLNFHKLTDPTTQLIYNMKHQLVFVIINRIKELP